MNYRIDMIIKLLIGAVIFFVLIGRKYLIQLLDFKKNKGTVWRGVEDHEKIDAAICRLNEVFKRPFDNFVLPDEIADILKREPESEYALNLFLQRAAAHCGYDREKIILKLDSENRNKTPGRITKLGSMYLMEISSLNSGNLCSTLAVIVHEFCHFFLDCSGIKLVSTMENEILTDVAAVYFGFGDIMREGYRPTFSIDNGKNMWRRVGYVDVRGIEYAKEKCEHQIKVW